jgi:hypothetical protein
MLNRSDRKLAFSVGGKSFECEAGEVIEVPDGLVSAVYKRGLPLRDVATMPKPKPEGED